MRISDFAAHSGLSPDTIRYYERIGLLPRTARDRGGRRDYGADDLAWASFLRKLQAMDMPIRDRLEYSRLRAKGSTTMRARREILEAHRAALAARRAELGELIATLDAKITRYLDMESGSAGINDDDGSTRDDDGSGCIAARQPAITKASARG